MKLPSALAELLKSVNDAAANADTATDATAANDTMNTSATNAGADATFADARLRNAAMEGLLDKSKNPIQELGEKLQKQIAPEGQDMVQAKTPDAGPGFAEILEKGVLGAITDSLCKCSSSGKDISLLKALAPSGVSIGRSASLQPAR